MSDSTNTAERDRLAKEHCYNLRNGTIPPSEEYAAVEIIDAFKAGWDARDEQLGVLISMIEAIKTCYHPDDHAATDHNLKELFRCVESLKKATGGGES